ncbi:DUF2478 domain-containing protein [Paracoccus sp. APAP_BH8]|uniref:DUF2478 domain-containing protein n=1 Tax=Paracoccus sp. APAP_BH8 TaxID=3110237 RepID=UPI003FA6E7EB
MPRPSRRGRPRSAAWHGSWPSARPDGPVLRISEDRGNGARGCRLDAGVLEAAEPRQRCRSSASWARAARWASGSGIRWRTPASCPG